MRVCWDEDAKAFIVIPSLDELKEIRQLGDKFVLPDVVVVAMIINVRLDKEFAGPFHHPRRY